MMMMMMVMMMIITTTTLEHDQTRAADEKFNILKTATR